MKKLRTSIRLSDELFDKVEVYRKEKMIKSKNDAMESLIELGLIRNSEDKIIEDYLIQIIKQNNLILKKLSGK
ncbi:MAG: hypothetical protein IJ134_04675 [Bacilli bacterium]|nr:hypothetical protein [Bacilli bacterium]